jgi:hypothetical protein
MPSIAGMLAKTVKQQHGGRPTAAETIGTSQFQQQKGRLAKTRMPEIVETSRQGTSNSRDANSTI